MVAGVHVFVQRGYIVVAGIQVFVQRRYNVIMVAGACFCS